MNEPGNIVIGDRTALYFLTHHDAAALVTRNRTNGNPLGTLADSSSQLELFNVNNPLYGSKPITLLSPERSARRTTSNVTCALCSCDLPKGSFFQLKPNLYMATPELVFLRMASQVGLYRLAEIGIELCARYFIHCATGKPLPRTNPLTTPRKLTSYLEKCHGIRGSRKARKAMGFIMGNSASPMEGKMKLQFCNALHHGGFNLAFTHFNYDIRAGKLAGITNQGEYSIDLANPTLHTGIEYDGDEYHTDIAKDLRRRNELKTLGWDVFPLRASMLYSPAATIQFGCQVAKHMGIRLRFPKNWDEKFTSLRREIDLPVDLPSA